MNTQLFLIGLAKTGFGVVVAVLGVFLGLRLLSLLLGQRRSDEELSQGNIAVGVLQAGCLLALGLLVQHAVTATFDAMDLLYRGQSLSARMFARFSFYALVHVGASMVVGSLVIAIGVVLFGKLTRGVDELAEVRKGNIAPALVLAAVMIVMALVTAPGLKTALDGLLPLPELPRDTIQINS